MSEMQKFHIYHYIPYIHFSEHEYVPKIQRLRTVLSDAVNCY